MDLPAELRERLADLRGDLLWERLSGRVTDAGWLACELIEAGLDTPAVWELAGYALSVGPMKEVEPLVRQVLAESGFPAVDLQREPWAVARDVAQAVATDDELRQQASKIAQAAPGWRDALQDPNLLPPS